MSKMGSYFLDLMENGEIDPDELDYPEPDLDEEDLIDEIVDLQDDGDNDEIPW